MHCKFWSKTHSVSQANTGRLKIVRQQHPSLFSLGSRCSHLRCEPLLCNNLLVYSSRPVSSCPVLASSTTMATDTASELPPSASPPPDAVASTSSAGEQVLPHVAKAWKFFDSIGKPKYHVAPMVDQSELPFRLLCRRNGATCAYTPMFHARLFSEDKKYRSECWSTCPEDRPLLVQFCANDPTYLVKAATLLEKDCDAIDINFGCPQRIAKRGFYGAFLMDNLELVEQLVSELSQSISIPVTCKIRIFPELDKTIAYAKMVERSGCSILAVHGRTRDQKDNSSIRADWDAIKAVKQALSIPVLANGNIRTLQDANDCMEYTGCDGVLSAESLLVDPALYNPSRLLPEQGFTSIHGISLLRDYLQLVLEYPVLMRIVKGHVHKLVGPWLSEHTDLRDKVNSGRLSIQGLLDEVVEVLDQRVKDCGRMEPIPKVTDRAQKRLEKEAAMKASMDEQEREAQALAGLNAGKLDAKLDSPPEQACIDCSASRSEQLGSDSVAVTEGETQPPAADGQQAVP